MEIHTIIQQQTATRTNQDAKESKRSTRTEWHGLDLTHHPKVYNAVRTIVGWWSDPDSRGLIMLGGNGCGKSHIAKVLYQAAGAGLPVTQFDGSLRAIPSAVNYPEPNLLDDIRAGYNDPDVRDYEQAIIRRCLAARFLIIDEVGRGEVSHSAMPWYQRIIWKIIDGRLENGKTLIISNLEPDVLRVRVGEANSSRFKEMLANERYLVDMFNVPDYRTKILKGINK